jgi:hypothetical protein
MDAFGLGTSPWDFVCTSMEILLVLLGGLHHMTAGVGATAPLIAAWLRLLEYRSSDPRAGRIGRTLARLSLLASLLAVAIGTFMLAVHWFAADGSYRGALGRVAVGRYSLALGELTFYFATMAAYLLLWQRLNRRPYLHGSLALLASMNLLYHIPPFMVMLALLASRPELAEVTLNRTLYRTLWADPEVASRVVHWWIASFAMAAVAHAHVASQEASSNRTGTGDANRLVAWGARAAILAVVLQVATGIWVLLAIAPQARAALTGSDAWATMFLLTGIGLMFVLIQQLMPTALGEPVAGIARRAAGLMLTVLILMTAASHRVRGMPTETLQRPAVLREDDDKSVDIHALRRLDRVNGSGNEANRLTTGADRWKSSR